jgi:hypothetical protein
VGRHIRAFLAATAAPDQATRRIKLTLSIAQEIRLQAPLDATFAALLLHCQLEERQGGSSKGARQSARRKPGQDHVGSAACPAEPRVPAVALCSAPSELLHWRERQMCCAPPRERQMCCAPPRERPISRASAVGPLAHGGTLVSFRHTAMGLIPDEHRAGVETGWNPPLNRVRRSAEKAARG